MCAWANIAGISIGEKIISARAGHVIEPGVRKYVFNLREIAHRGAASRQKSISHLSYSATVSSAGNIIITRVSHLFIKSRRHSASASAVGRGLARLKQKAWPLVENSVAASTRVVIGSAGGVHCCLLPIIIIVKSSAWRISSAPPGLATRHSKYCRRRAYSPLRSSLTELKHIALREAISRALKMGARAVSS